MLFILSHRWRTTVNNCDECKHDFDDNGDKSLCKTCEDWIVQGKQTTDAMYPFGDTLFRFTKDDIDAVTDPMLTDEERERCYEAVSRIDCSPIFEQIEIICQMALREGT